MESTSQGGSGVKANQYLGCNESTGCFKASDEVGMSRMVEGEAMVVWKPRE
jgi:hypothetical protein